MEAEGESHHSNSTGDVHSAWCIWLLEPAMFVGHSPGTQHGVGNTGDIDLSAVCVSGQGDTVELA